jgi:RNA-directed DNA polymerase
MNNKWGDLNWTQIEETVFNIQRKIYLSIKGRNIPAARNLQTILINMYEAKLLSVKIVTTNNGKNTLGVDKCLPIKDEEKFHIAYTLQLDGQTNYIRRVYIPKPGTKDLRPLGIPTIIDRCKQCLCKLALEPEAEAKFECNSYGFRPGRSAIDAVAKIRSHLIFNGPCYVLDTDIRKCFDRIDHMRLLQKVSTIPIIDYQIQAWLRAGIFDKNEIIYPTQGTPQGGIISPLLANIAIDGIQNYIYQEITKKYGEKIAFQTYYIRYADDLVCFAPTSEVINDIKSLVTTSLNYMNLELKEEVTRTILTVHCLGVNKYKSEHFDFLGFRFKQRYLSIHKEWKDSGKMTRFRTFVLISPSRIERHKASISNIMKKIGNVKELIKELNPRIVGWCNYFKHSDAKEYGDLPRKMDLWINTKIRKWIRKNTKLRGKPEQFWIKDTKDWVLYYKDENGNNITLTKYNSYKWAIYTYRAINSYFSPYKLDYKNYNRLN